jgi:hypothetical protein
MRRGPNPRGFTSRRHFGKRVMTGRRHLTGLIPHAGELSSSGCGPDSATPHTSLFFSHDQLAGTYIAMPPGTGEAR